MDATRKSASHITAFLDTPDSPDIVNPLPSTEGAAAFGYPAPLLGGVTVYGWAVPAILDSLGEGWLARGWADIAFRRPVYPGDELTVTVEPADGAAADLTIANQRGERCIAGRVGLGDGAGLSDLTTPTRRQPEERPPELPLLTLEVATAGGDLRPMAVPLTPAEARAYATERQQDPSPRWVGAEALAHPSWLAARLSPLMHHSFDYGPSIHAHSLIQHLEPARVGQTFTVAGRFVEGYERKGHHYALVDALVLSEGGEELVRIRHTSIFRIAPRA